MIHQLFRRLRALRPNLTPAHLRRPPTPTAHERYAVRFSGEKQSASGLRG